MTTASAMNSGIRGTGDIMAMDSRIRGNGDTIGYGFHSRRSQTISLLSGHQRGRDIADDAERFRGDLVHGVGEGVVVAVVGSVIDIKHIDNAQSSREQWYVVVGDRVLRLRNEVLRVTEI